MSAATERIGQLLGGKYRVQQVLATGGMGFVYAARHQVTGRAVAVKLLRPELVTRPDLVQRVRQEARLAVDAAHPNVVEVLDAGADEAGMPYVVLERLYGQPLEALLEQPLSLQCTLEALVPVCNALAALHQTGIVHRDLKPSNIFLSREESGRIVPKLLDFGIAKVLESNGSTLTGMTLGTPAYMAPEQLLCNVASPASDVWSLAVVYVRCLTGRLPFADLAQRGLLAFGGNARPLELNGVAEPVARVLASALRFEAGERPASAGMFRAQLFSALQEFSPGQSWPNASIVGFAEDDSALGLALKDAGGAAATGESRAMRGRPRDVLTQTLSRALHSAWTRRSRWQRAFALLAAVLSVLTLASWPGGTRTRAQALRPQALHVALENNPAREEATGATQSETVNSAARAPGDTHRVTNPLPAAPSRNERDRASPTSRRKPSEPASTDILARPPSQRTTAVSKEPARPTLTPLIMGANRSPIIE